MGLPEPAPSTRRGIVMRPDVANPLAASVAVLVLVFVMACSSERGDWETATAAGTVEALEDFLREHPQSSLADSARILTGVVTIEGRVLDESGSPVTGLEVRILEVHADEDGTRSCVTPIRRNEETGDYEVASPGVETDGAERFAIVVDRALFEEEGFCVQALRSTFETGLTGLGGGAVRFEVPENERVSYVGEITIHK